jgi:hypothetical protein
MSTIDIAVGRSKLLMPVRMTRVDWAGAGRPLIDNDSGLRTKTGGELQSIRVWISLAKRSRIGHEG